MTRFLVKLAMPMTSCGTTCPTEMTRSQPSRRVLSTSIGTAVVIAPPDRAAISSAGTSPRRTSLSRQSWRSTRSKGTDPKQAATWARVMGRCVPSAGRAHTSQPDPVSDSKSSCVIVPARPYMRVWSGGTSRTRAGPSGPGLTASTISCTAPARSARREDGMAATPGQHGHLAAPRPRRSLPPRSVVAAGRRSGPCWRRKARRPVRRATACQEGSGLPRRHVRRRHTESAGTARDGSWKAVTVSRPPCQRTQPADPPGRAPPGGGECRPRGR